MGSRTGAADRSPEGDDRVSPRSRPLVWVLLGKGTGGNGQMLSLAEALGWPYETRRLVHNPLHVVPNLLLGASRVSVDRRRSDPLEPPWPDLVIAASRRSAPVARWIRRRSGGRTRLVHLLHAQAPLAHFDLVVTMPQYRLPERPNVMHVTGALNRIDPAQRAEAARAWQERLAHLPRPWVALVVGGDSSAYRFDPETAARLGREASELARKLGGSLLVSTTPRTPAASTDELVAAIDCPAYVYRWRPDDPENPYVAFLALADHFVVTVDSASLPMEACATGKPVQVFEWPRRDGAPSVPQREWGWLYEWGIVKPPRDFDAYHRALRRRGLATRLGERARVPSGPPDDLERVADRVRALLRDDAEGV
jgi:mitochondrial fission protein ELM1